MSVALKPSLLRPRNVGNPNALGKFSFIINETSRRHHWSGVGCLSIKSFHGGEAFYDVGRGRYRVGSNSYLILNQSQPYEITVDAERAFESFCLFFEDGFAEEVLYSLNTPAAKLLDNPQAPQPASVCFFEKTYPHDDILSPALFRFKAELPNHKNDEVWINQQFHGILQRLMEVHRGVCREVESLPAMRASTREELYRRLHRAKEFIAASFDQSITIDEMAKVACLSTNHFLRTFQQAFRQTPHQFLTAQRLERAQRLLLHTDLPVTDVCLAVGFESLGSFSSLFRRKLGASPEKFRRAKR
ncbi:MAG: helix-turn-helix domain-containing protein [Blastocatellales bacterium]